MIARYMVCDTPHPVASVVGLCRLDDSVKFDYRKACLKRKGHHCADVTTGRGLFFLQPKTHSRPPHVLGNFLFAPAANSSSYAAPEARTESSGHPTVTDSTNEKLWRKDYRPQTCSRGSRRRGRGDYWMFVPGGRHAVREHLRPRRALYAPSVSNTG